jgi:hypothetical protein
MAKFGIDSNMIFDADGKSVATRLSDHDTQMADIATDVGNFKLQIPEVDDAPRIQRAINSLNKSNAGVLRFPKGTFKISSQYLLFLGISNLTIEGSGKGATILDATDTTIFTHKGEWSPAMGALKIEGQDQNTPAYNIRIKDLTIKRNSNPLNFNVVNERNQHNTFFGNVRYITFERVEFDGSSMEQCYTEGNDLTTPRHIRVHDCVFRNGAPTDSYSFASFNTNTVWSEDIVIDGCYFTDTQTGIMVLGFNITITNNNFKNVSRNPIYVGESNGTARHSLGSCVVDGNTIEGLGANRINNSPCQGIAVVLSTRLFDDGTEDIGCIISNNSILNTRYSHSASVVAIQTLGTVKINDNFIAGLRSEDASTNNCTAIQASNNENLPANVYLSNNVVAVLKAVNELKFNFGVYLAHQKDSAYYLSDNVFKGSATCDIFLQPATTGESAALLSLCNDITNGLIIGRGTFGENAINADGILNNVPLTGTNKTSLIALNSVINMPTLPVNSVSPDVKGLNQVITANTSATTYTDFTNPLGSQKLCIHVNDSNTTLQNNSKIRLSGNVNFNASLYSTIELQFNPHTLSWVETYRHLGS